jgi:hypothetical protein
MDITDLWVLKTELYEVTQEIHDRNLDDCSSLKKLVKKKEQLLTQINALESKRKND